MWSPLLRPSMLGLLAVGLLATACAVQPGRSATPQPGVAQPELSSGPSLSSQVAHYNGQLITSSMDGRIIYGLPRLAAMQRTVAPSQHRIVEEIVTEVGQLSLVLTQQEGSSRFEARSVGGEIIGYVIMQGQPWRWTSWSYHFEPTYTLDLSEGRLTRQGIELVSTEDVARPGVTRRTLYQLKKVEREVYEAMRSKILDQ